MAYADSGFPGWVEYAGRLTTEACHCPDSAAHSGRRAHPGGPALETTVCMEDDDRISITPTTVLRYDPGNPERTGVDIREACFLTYGDVSDDEWEFAGCLASPGRRLIGDATHSVR